MPLQSNRVTTHNDLDLVCAPPLAYIRGIIPMQGGDMADQIADDDKLRELIIYISERCETDPRFGAVNLNKILFYSDFVAYGKTGKSITGQPYQRLKQGPAPKRLLPVRREMMDTDLAIKKADYYGRQQERPV